MSSKKGVEPLVHDYVPLEVPMMFHRSDADNRWIVGGYGSSKTRAICEEAWALAIEYPGTRIAVIRRTYPSLRDTTMRVFEEVCPGRFIFYENKTEHIKELRVPSWPEGLVSTILFRSFDNADAIKKVMSDEYGAIVIDEVTDFSWEEVMRIKSRLRHKAGPLKTIYASNSGGKDAYYDAFHPGEGTMCRLWNKCPLGLYHQDWCRRPVQRQVVREIEIGGKKVRQSFEMFVSCTAENHHLPMEYIADLLLLPDEQKKRYFYCSFDIFAGQIYTEWNPRVHVVEPFEIPADWRRIRGLDHGLNHPTCVLWAAIDNDGFIYFYDEHYESGRTPSYHSEKIKEKSGGEKWRGMSVADPHIFDKTQIGKEDEGRQAQRYSVAEIYRDYGITWRKGDNNVDAGIAQVREYLHIDPTAIHPLTHEEGSPRVFFFAGKCPNLIRQMGNWKYKEGTEDPVDVDDDAVDVARYIMMTRPRLRKQKENVPFWQINRIVKEAQRLSRERSVCLEDGRYDFSRYYIGRPE